MIFYALQHFQVNDAKTARSSIIATVPAAIHRQFEDCIIVFHLHRTLLLDIYLHNDSMGVGFNLFTSFKLIDFDYVFLSVVVNHLTTNLLPLALAVSTEDGQIGTEAAEAADTLPNSPQDFTENSLYLDVGNPATVTGTISSLRYCYLPSPICFGIPCDTTVAIYRFEEDVYTRVSTLIDIKLTPDTVFSAFNGEINVFKCDDLAVSPSVEVERGDVFGTCTVSQPNTLNLLGAVSEDGSDTSLLQKVDVSNCETATISIQGVSVVNETLLFLYASISKLHYIMIECMYTLCIYVPHLDGAVLE